MPLITPSQLEFLVLYGQDVSSFTVQSQQDIGGQPFFIDDATIFDAVSVAEYYGEEDIPDVLPESGGAPLSSPIWGPSDPPPTPMPAPVPWKDTIIPVPVPQPGEAPDLSTLITDPSAIDAATVWGAGTSPLDVLDPLNLFHDDQTEPGGLFRGSEDMPHTLEDEIMSAGGGGIVLAARTVIDIIRRSGAADDVIRIGRSQGGSTSRLRDVWGQLSLGQQQALATAAAAGGLVMSDLLDFPFDLGLFGGSGGAAGAVVAGGLVLTPGWVANGVQFYYVSDGRLAVQRKNGSWKYWRPKKPIVLFASGAKDMQTMLRADNALNKQAKRIASMLNRRAPRRKSTPKGPTHTHGAGGTSIINVE